MREAPFRKVTAVGVPEAEFLLTLSCGHQHRMTVRYGMPDMAGSYYHPPKQYRCHDCLNEAVARAEKRRGRKCDRCRLLPHRLRDRARALRGPDRDRVAVAAVKTHESEALRLAIPRERYVLDAHYAKILGNADLFLAILRAGTSPDALLQARARLIVGKLPSDATQARIASEIQRAIASLSCEDDLTSPVLPLADLSRQMPDPEEAMDWYELADLAVFRPPPASLWLHAVIRDIRDPLLCND